MANLAIPIRQRARRAEASVCPKNPSWVYLQDAKVGDVFTIDAEFLLIVAKNGNQWTLQRGYGLSSPSDHGSTEMTAHCLSRDFYHGVANWSWTWDTARDPHGINSDGTTVRVAWDYDHPVPRTDVTLGGMPSYDSSCQLGGTACYAIRTGTGPMGDPPNRYAAMAPPFANATGTASFVERAQDHPSWLQDNAASPEKQWLTDGRPLTPLMDISDSAMAVSGQLYRLTSVTTDGDNLHQVGYNIYVVRTSPTTLVAGGNCSARSPCPIWNDTTLIEAITTPCTITVVSGSGSVYVYGMSSGGLGVNYTSGLTIRRIHVLRLQVEAIQALTMFGPRRRGRYGHGVRVPGRGRQMAQAIAPGLPARSAILRGSSSQRGHSAECSL